MGGYWVGQVARWFKWFRKEGQVGLDWFGLEGSKSNTISKLVSESVTKVGIELLGQLKIYLDIYISINIVERWVRLM